MNSKNSKTSDPHQLLSSLRDKINSNRNDKSVALSNRSIYYSWKNVKKSYKTINLKFQVQHGMKNIELPDWSYSLSEIQDYFEYILKTTSRKDY